MRRKILNIIIVILASLLVIGILCFGYYRLFMNPYRGTISEFDSSRELETVLTRGQAEEDLKYLYEHLESRHPAWLDGSAELTDAVKVQYEKELMDLGYTVTELQLLQAASRITAKLHDGHTGIDLKDPGVSLYINDFSQINDYGKPVSINGIPTEDIYQSYLAMASYELDFYAEAKFKNSICYEIPLRMYGVDTSNGVDMTFNTPNGEKTYHYKFVPISQVVGDDNKENDVNWVYYSIDKEKNMGIFTLKKCTCDEEYRQALDCFFNEVFANGITNIAVDLRNNGGGNSMVANEFLKYIDIDTYNSWDCDVRCGWYLWKFKDITNTNQKKPSVFDGKIYVMTNTYTYSAAMDFAMLIGDNGLGVLVGSTSGNSPDAYGDCLYFQMPNSKFIVIISYKRWHRLDSTKSGEPLIPDYQVPESEVLNKIYELIGENQRKVTW